MTSFQIAEVSKVKLPNKFSNMLFLFVCCAHFTIVRMSCAQVLFPIAACTLR